MIEKDLDQYLQQLTQKQEDVQYSFSINCYGEVPLATTSSANAVADSDIYSKRNKSHTIYEKGLKTQHAENPLNKKQNIHHYFLESESSLAKKENPYRGGRDRATL